MNTEKTITITEEDFDRAITTSMDNSLRDPRFEGNLSAAMMYTLGGAVFAREVKNTLFGKEEHHDQ